MMAKQILITTFDVWLPHHCSNASDDLIAELLKHKLLPTQVTLLRKVVVDYELTLAAIFPVLEQLRPDLILCCGMAESRTAMTVESCAKHEGEVLQTAIDLDELVQGLKLTHISHDAGNFVCNHLYYHVLKAMLSSSPRGVSTEQKLSSQCLFIHVPPLTPENSTLLMSDFMQILQKLDRPIEGA